MRTHSLGSPPASIDLLQRLPHASKARFSLPVTTHISSLSENKLTPVTFVTGHVLPRPLHAITDQRRSDLTNCVPIFFPEWEEIVSAVVAVMLMFCAVIVMVKRIDNGREQRAILARDSSDTDF
jgi:hypothetical protein